MVVFCQDAGLRLFIVRMLVCGYLLSECWFEFVQCPAAGLRLFVVRV